MATKPYLSFSISESNISIANNTSTVSVTLYFTDPQGATWNSSGYFSLTVNGSTKSWTVNISQSTARRTIGTYSVTVPHNSDGSKTISISAYTTVSSYWGKISASTSKVLTKIKRATTPTVSNSSPELGTTVDITVNGADSRFTHKIEYVFLKKTGVIAENVKGTINFTLPIELAAEIPNSASGVMQIVCITYLDSAVIGSKTVSITAIVPDSCAVKITDINVLEAVENIKTKFALQNKFVEKLSKLSTTISSSSSASYGATVSKIETTIDGILYTGETFTTEYLQTVGDLEMSCKLTDSRGKVTLKTKTIKVLEYLVPSISLDINPDGSSVVCTMRGTVSPVDNKNTKKLLLTYRKMTEMSSGVEVPIDIAGDGYTFEKTFTAKNIDNEITYVFTATLTDSINNNFAEVLTGIPVISRLAGGKGVRLFGEAEQVGFWVGNVDYTITDAEFDELMGLLGG